MQITAKQYGQMMREQGILWPAPALGRADLVSPAVRVHRIGRRSLESCLVVERRGWGTVYCAPGYGDYRAAFDAVMPRTSMGRDVDHLMPRSQAARRDFVAMGRISEASNRGWNDGDDAAAMAQKVRDTMVGNPHGFTSFLTDMERGWAVVTCYLRPMGELDRGALSFVGPEEVRGALGAG
ncbi:hypothetical protein [Jannaschia marina]|uniref:hypothetical protein n=1 Tax=Jannaschia marina TaxID=2741674 RepID=UPI0015CA78B2|nr:hypothetical protein [Jannaschia marina]